MPDLDHLPAQRVGESLAVAKRSGGGNILACRVLPYQVGRGPQHAHRVRDHEANVFLGAGRHTARRLLVGQDDQFGLSLTALGEVFQQLESPEILKLIEDFPLAALRVVGDPTPITQPVARHELPPGRVTHLRGKIVWVAVWMPDNLAHGVGPPPLLAPRSVVDGIERGIMPMLRVPRVLRFLHVGPIAG